MTVSLEYLELIPKLLEEIKSLKLSQAMKSEKRWLTTRDLSDYIGYSIDAINKMVQSDVFIDGVHYYQPSKKLLFDKLEIDNWIIGIRSDRIKRDVNLIVDDVLNGIE
ncbi:MAG: hypothetical protein U9O83_02885 [Campylobacterota bacterium]|nr:hypothetical protein [Campylobacterota bacterium]